MNKSITKEDLDLLCNAAIKAARLAGDWVHSFDRSKLRQRFKDVGSTAASQIFTDVDLESERLIKESLCPVSKRYGIGFVGEESSVNSEQSIRVADEPCYWCVDPLDGTLAYVEGRHGYAISIALVSNQGHALIGVVYDPITGDLFHAVEDYGCYLNSQTFMQSVAKDSGLRVYADVSFKSHDYYDSAVDLLEKVSSKTKLLCVDFVYGGGAVVNACSALSSSNACYLKLPKKEAGGGSIWDFAATSVLANESSGWVSDVYGNDLKFDRSGSKFMNKNGVLYASNPELALIIVDELETLLK